MRLRSLLEASWTLAIMLVEACEGAAEIVLNRPEVLSKYVHEITQVVCTPPPSCTPMSSLEQNGTTTTSPYLTTLSWCKAELFEL